ncbi:MAG TPA: aminotransferase class V-fold PLP-dependent enzyme [Candidatus Dormibacteraeota bacterium]|nr:aminotransferase class V-fold PLP-dependent enzyme [Candidatus Dormibacteraeota bacterium]
MLDSDPLARRAELEPALRLAADSAMRFLSGIDRDPVRLAGADSTATAFDVPLPENGVGAVAVLNELAEIGSVAALRSAGPRFFHWATGGSTAAALGADWLTSAFDQNARFWANSPLACQLEEVSLNWLKDLLRLPAQWAGVLTSGATMATYAGLAASRRWWGARHGVDVDEDGLAGLEPVPIFTSGWIHPTTIKVLAMLGVGRRRITILARDGTGALDIERLQAALKALGGEPAIVIANAGEVNTGLFDPIREMADLCQRHGAWLHVDGAFGLFARLTPRAALLTDGIEEADSVASDCHKWLNVPYDCGFVFVRQAEFLEGAFRVGHAFIGETRLDFSSRSPENSRRARALTVWATLKAYGRNGYRTMVERHLELAQHLAIQVDAAPDMERLAPTPLNAVLFRYKPSGVQESRLDELNTRVGEAIMDDGRVYIGSTTSFGGPIGFRPVILNWRTTEADVNLILDVVRQVGTRVAGMYLQET